MFKKILTLLLTFTIILSFNLAYARELFLDVPEDDWAAPFIYNLADRGIVSGYGDGYFGRNNDVLRCEYAKMLVEISKTPINQSSFSPYADVPVNEWYFPYVTSSLSYMTGYQTSEGILYFDPEAPASREVVTVAIVKALNLDVSKETTANQFLAEKFSDWENISTHNRAYIAAAVKKGFITGDQEGTFRPESPIIRAEVAIVLQRAFPDGKVINPGA